MKKYQKGEETGCIMSWINWNIINVNRRKYQAQCLWWAGVWALNLWAASGLAHLKPEGCPKPGSILAWDQATQPRDTAHGCDFLGLAQRWPLLAERRVLAPRQPGAKYLTAFHSVPVTWEEGLKNVTPLCHVQSGLPHYRLPLQSPAHYTAFVFIRNRV